MKVIFKLLDYFVFLYLTTRFDKKNQNKYVISNRGDEIYGLCNNRKVEKIKKK